MLCLLWKEEKENSFVFLINELLLHNILRRNLFVPFSNPFSKQNVRDGKERKITLRKRNLSSRERGV